MEKSQLKFNRSINAFDFQSAFRQRVESYFTDNRISKKGNFPVYFKFIFGIATWIISYFLLLKYGNTPGLLVLLFALHGLTHVFIGLNIAHDACHDSLFRKRSSNFYAACLFDCVGINSFRWRYFHNRMHHPFTNIIGKDPYIVPTKWLRFSNYLVWKKAHSFQHFYVFILYGLTTIFWCITSDISFFFSKKRQREYQIEVKPKDFLVFFFLKLFYLAYCILLPVLLLDIHWLYVLLGFGVLHFINGLIISFVLQSGHIQDDLLTAESNGEEIKHDSFDHTLQSTLDHGFKSPVYSWLMGNINLHTVHHLYPGICHIHYKKLTAILHQTAAEFNVAYNGNCTPFHAFYFHIENLKQLSRQSQPSTT